MKAYFNIVTVGDFVSYSPTILQILCRHDIDAYLISWSLI
nr:MAG TPA_asm: hypothetical protein [Caudoviricetes sp.]